MDDNSELTVAELIELERAAIQAIGETLAEHQVDMQAYQKASDRLDLLFEMAKRGQITEEKWEEEREFIRAMIHSAEN
jgi:hypothetical protein